MKHYIYIGIVILVIAISVILFSQDTVMYHDEETPQVAETPTPVGAISKEEPIRIGTKQFRTRLEYRAALSEQTNKMTAHVNKVSALSVQGFKEWAEYAQNEMKECRWREMVFKKDGGGDIDLSDEDDVLTILEDINNRMITSCGPITKITR